MPVVKIEPSDEHPLPYRLEDEKTDSFYEELTVAASTAEFLEELGAPVEVDPSTYDREKSLVDAVTKGKHSEPLKNYPTALAANAFLKAYAQNLAYDVNQVRSALTNKLLEIADCGDPKYELKAIELLGKHSDIGLFTERSEVTVNYNSPDSLEAAIKERVKRLLNADVIDVLPIEDSLDDELGVYIPKEHRGRFDTEEEEEPPEEELLEGEEEEDE